MTRAEPLPRWVRVVTVASVALVAVVAAVASYVHMQALATRAGEEWRAILTPLSVDGMLVAASMVIFVRRRAGLSPGGLPVLGLVAGILASLGANVAAGHPEWDSPWLAGVIAAWPPVALAISFDLLILVHRQPSPPSREGAGGVTDQGGETWEAKRDRLLLEGAGRKVLAAELGISEWDARKLLADRSADQEDLA